jgi:hypothetical protein
VSYGALITGRAQFAGLDQGIDFTGPGLVRALGAGRITRLQPSGSGWPGEGAIVAYQITEKGSPLDGRFMYIAEDFRAIRGLQVGSTFKRGQVLGVATGSGLAPGIETGFASDAQGHAYGNPKEGHGAEPDPEARALQAYLEGGANAYEGVRGITSKEGSIAKGLAEGLGAAAKGVQDAGQAVLNAPGEAAVGAAKAGAEAAFTGIVDEFDKRALKILLYAVFVFGAMALIGYGVATMISPRPPSLRKAAVKAAEVAAA